MPRPRPESVPAIWRRYKCRWCTRTFTVGESGGGYLTQHCELEHPAEVARIRRKFDAAPRQLPNDLDAEDAS